MFISAPRRRQLRRSILVAPVLMTINAKLGSAMMVNVEMCAFAILIAGDLRSVVQRLLHPDISGKKVPLASASSVSPGF